MESRGRYGFSCRKYAALVTAALLETDGKFHDSDFPPAGGRAEILDPFYWATLPIMSKQPRPLFPFSPITITTREAVHSPSYSIRLREGHTIEQHKHIVEQHSPDIDLEVLTEYIHGDSALGLTYSANLNQLIITAVRSDAAVLSVTPKTFMPETGRRVAEVTYRARSGHTR